MKKALTLGLFFLLFGSFQFAVAKAKPVAVMRDPIKVATAIGAVRWTQMDFGPDGVAHVIWEVDYYDRTGHDVWYVSYDGKKASTPINLKNSASVAERPNIKVGPAGEIVVVWGDDGSIYLRMYNPVTEKWGDIERVVSGYGWSEPMAAFDPAGNLFLWWYNEGGIVYSLAKVDGKWENVHRLSSWNIGKQGGIAVGSDGQVWTVWREKEGDGEYKNWYAKRTASSDWSKPQRVNDAGASSSHPHITVGPDNVPVTAYGDIDEATGHAQQMWICTIDEKTNPRELVLDAYMQHYPRIAIDINGKIHLACQLGGGDYGDGIRYTNNVLGEWKHTQGFKASWPKLPGIAADAFGNVGLCWSSIAFADNTSGIWFTSLYEVKPQANEPPVADFSFSPQRGIAPLRVNFDASPSYDPDGNIVAYEWNYGDGKTATGETVAHTFKRGIYSVTLTVTDNRGDTASKTKYVDASVSMYPPLNLTIDTAVNNLRKVPEVTYNLGWQANPQNEAEFFQGYKIYKKEEGGTWQLLVSVTGTTYSASFNFKDPQVRRQFAMTAFATTGKESEMVFFGSQ